jgi:hypothetical protein
MKFEKNIFISLAIVIGLLSSLHGNNQIVLGNTQTNAQIEKEQIQDSAVLVFTLGELNNASNSYFQKHDSDLKIKCKNCIERKLTIGEFEGCLMAWVIKALADSHNVFEKTKKILDRYIKLLSEDASAEQLIIFMLNTANDMKQQCFHCPGTSWEKIN